MKNLSGLHFCVVRTVTGLVMLAAAAGAQQVVSSVRIFAEPAGASFMVDGIRYTGSATFMWAANSRHEVSVIPLQYSTQIKARFAFEGWTDSTGLVRGSDVVQTVIANPALTFIKAGFRTEYALSLVFFKCPSVAPGACQSPGTIYVNGTPHFGNAELYFQPGAAVELRAQPSPGFLFTGWLQGTGNSSRAFLNRVIMDTPRAIYPKFERSGYITLESSPPGFQILADHSPVVPPVSLEWGVGTMHTVGVISPQMDRRGNIWVFNSWSDGGASTHAYRMPAELQANLRLTAVFVPAARVSFLTSPPGLNLKVDGREKWQSYSFSWAPGSKHVVEAPERQVDRSGRVWIFQSWSNGGAAAQEVVTPEDTDVGLRLMAVYEALGQVTIRTSPPGIPVEADGEACVSPCILERRIGATVRLRAPANAPAAEGSRLDFESWLDGAAAEREFTVPPDPVTVTASYRQRFLLMMDAEPAEAAQFLLEPASPDGYYDAGQAVVLTLEPEPGFKFRGWEGDLSGTARSAAVVMTGPRHARALFQAVPHVPPNGLRNAAGETPDGTVAPGSIISIVGVNLAAGTESGPGSPLAQTLAGVWVQMGDRMLPLFSVSPEQINALLPPDLEEGEHRLAVRRDGEPEARISFQTARNAPGLFSVDRDGRSFCLAAHADGSPVSLESPARRGEVITLFGTGFGPYDRKPPLGFAVPETPAYILSDPVELVSGELVLSPEFAGAAAGQVGIDAIRLRIGDTLPSGSIELRARVNGRESRPVLLTIEGAPAEAEAEVDSSPEQ